MRGPRRCVYQAGSSKEHGRYRNVLVASVQIIRPQRHASVAAEDLARAPPRAQLDEHSPRERRPAKTRSLPERVDGSTQSGKPCDRLANTLTPRKVLAVRLNDLGNRRGGTPRPALKARSCSAC